MTSTATATTMPAVWFATSSPVRPLSPGASVDANAPKPAQLTGARLVAVAARDRNRAEAFAAQHGVERVLDSYAEVISDPEVEVVYNPLANGLHAP